MELSWQVQQGWIGGSSNPQSRGSPHKRWDCSKAKGDWGCFGRRRFGALICDKNPWNIFTFSLCTSPLTKRQILAAWRSKHISNFVNFQTWVNLLKWGVRRGCWILTLLLLNSSNCLAWRGKQRLQRQVLMSGLDNEQSIWKKYTGQS